MDEGADHVTQAVQILDDLAAIFSTPLAQLKPGTLRLGLGKVDELRLILHDHLPLAERTGPPPGPPPGPPRPGAIPPGPPPTARPFPGGPPRPASKPDDDDDD